MATYHRDVVECFIRDLPPTSENRKALIQRRHDVLLPSGSDLNAVSQGGNKKKKKKKKKYKREKLKRLDLNCFLVNNIFGDDGFQNMFVYQVYFNT